MNQKMGQKEAQERLREMGFGVVVDHLELIEKLNVQFKLDLQEMREENEKLRLQTGSLTGANYRLRSERDAARSEVIKLSARLQDLKAGELIAPLVKL